MSVAKVLFSSETTSLKSRVSNCTEKTFVSWVIVWAIWDGFNVVVFCGKAGLWKNIRSKSEASGGGGKFSNNSGVEKSVEYILG